MDHQKSYQKDLLPSFDRPYATVIEITSLKEIVLMHPTDRMIY